MVVSLSPVSMGTDEALRITCTYMYQPGCELMRVEPMSISRSFPAAGDEASAKPRRCRGPIELVVNVFSKTPKNV